MINSLEPVAQECALLKRVEDAVAAGTGARMANEVTAAAARRVRV